MFIDECLTVFLHFPLLLAGFHRQVHFTLQKAFVIDTCPLLVGYSLLELDCILGHLELVLVLLIEVSHAPLLLIDIPLHIIYLTELLGRVPRLLVDLLLFSVFLIKFVLLDHVPQGHLVVRIH